jgi:hypothetical protein
MEEPVNLLLDASIRTDSAGRMEEPGVFDSLVPCAQAVTRCVQLPLLALDISGMDALLSFLGHLKFCQYQGLVNIKS